MEARAMPVPVPPLAPSQGSIVFFLSVAGAGHCDCRGGLFAFRVSCLLMLAQNFCGVKCGVGTSDFDKSYINISALWPFIGGEGGIRTPGTVTRTPHFECGAIDHSATSPEPRPCASLRLRFERRAEHISRAPQAQAYPSVGNFCLFEPKRRL